ncbi:MAG: hypothetical protein AUJ82_00390 [Verrucomicrobia bacterium CG1_02_43_26]|nr:MAG: hypothetical protein AUJ82_00390 [Verrucomicrobia bacterium CG1_02_43_26]
MSEIFDIMPGIETKIKDISDELSNMWKCSADDDSLPSDHGIVHACQMNLILHLGKDTDPEDALKCFWTAVHFAQMRPSRIIVLCPEQNEQETPVAKLFAQCYLGDDFRSKCCCDAIIIDYTPNRFDVLVTQISLWLENDLPTSYWIHRVCSEYLMQHATKFAQQCRNVVYDSSIEDKRFKTISWKKETNVRDLLGFRLLTVRQALGQLLSTYKPEMIVESLQSVHISCVEPSSPYAESIQEWQQNCLLNCSEDVAEQVRFSIAIENIPEDEASMKCIWHYTDDRKEFAWQYCHEKHELQYSIKIDGELHQYTARLHTFSPERILAETLV